LFTKCGKITEVKEAAEKEEEDENNKEKAKKEADAVSKMERGIFPAKPLAATTSTTTGASLEPFGSGARVACTLTTRISRPARSKRWWGLRN